jgi:integrase
MKLSDLKCRKATAPDRLIKLADGQGLYLHVYPNGKKLWRLSYRYDGKQRDLAFGPYPHISLLDARKKREAARDLLCDNKDPGAVRQREIEAEAECMETTFGAFANLYLDRLAATGRSQPTIKKARWIVEDLAGELRPTQVSDITPRDVLRALRAVEAKGNRETARRMRGVLSAVFRLAVIEGAIDIDPTAALQGALLPPKTNHHAAITDPAAFGGLLRVIDGYEGHRSIKIVLQLLALTFPRPGELRHAEWIEVDLPGALWIIPAERTKMRREHRIPLSRQALDCFSQLKDVTGRGARCFPSIRSLNSPLSDGALNAALRALGVEGSVHVSHGFRSSASSLLNEHSAFSSEAIERALAHGEPDKVRRAYNRAQYWDERVQMMQWWADYLDRLRKTPSRTPIVAEAPGQLDLFA